MRKELQLAMAALFTASICHAQEQTTRDPMRQVKEDNASFVFTESQMGEDDDMTQNIIMVNSNNNVYASNVGYLFSPMRFKFRAYNSRYNDIYFNGVSVNNAESGQFNYSTIGGMNDATRSVESASPFENNRFSMPGLGGSNNYDLRASNYAAGGKVTLSGANRNYQARGILTYATGLTSNGWAFMGTVGYRYGKNGIAEGTFYNSLSYFLAAQKIINEKHSLSLSTWGNPSERAQQGASTDEAYWLANDRFYNPYWGYQNGKVRSSRVVNNYEPTALLTWDFEINDRAKLTTSLIGRYAMYSSTKLNYNGAENPAPDYWKNFPSAVYNVWDEEDVGNTPYSLQSWQNSFDYWTASKANRQIQWDRLYAANRTQNSIGQDAAYYIQAKHNDHLMVNLSSTFNYDINRQSKFQVGLQIGTNKGMHYQTMEDMMGANMMHNINNYAIGTYTTSDPRIQYDLNNPNGEVHEGDRFGYDYNIFTDNAKLFATYSLDKGNTHTFISGRIGGTQMWRDGKMRNGMAADNSYGKSGTAYFLDGGAKAGMNINLGRGHIIAFGVGFETRAPQANVSFAAPEINNDFAWNLKCEQVASAELSYSVNSTYVRANLTGYYTHTTRGNEWQNYYFDDVNSFTYVSLSGVEKNYYGVELGLQFKVTSNFTINLIGALNEAKYTKNTDVVYMNSTEGTYNYDLCYNKDMRESGTPLTTANIGLNYRINGWYFNLNGNYYDRIYLSYSPCLRYKETLETMGNIDNEGNYIVPEQTKGKGGFMLDASIGKSIRLGKHTMNINLMLTNITNNTKLVSGGYEQSRSSYTVSRTTGEKASERIYDFQHNPKKYYVQGINGMLNVNYRF